MNPDSPLKAASKIAIAVLLILLTGAVYFYKERMLFLDAPFICYRVLTLGKLTIMEHRYGSFITQVVPLIGGKLHLSLKIILIAYSASFNLFYLLVGIILYRSRQYGLAILLAIYFTLFASETFFWTNNEVHQGVAWLFLFFGVVFVLKRKNVSSILQIPVFIFLSALAIFTHPLIMISALYLWGFFAIGRAADWLYNKKQTIFFSVLLIAVIAGKYVVSNFWGYYDEGKMHNATHCTLPQIIALFHNKVAFHFLHDLAVKYTWSIIIFLLGLFILLKQKRYLQTAWFLLWTIGFYLLMGLTYGEEMLNRNTVFYMESEWLTYSLILSAPFVFYFLPVIKRNLAAGIMVLLFATRLISIAQASSIFSARVHLLEVINNSLNLKGIKKAVIPQNASLDSSLLMNWGLPVETLILSAINHQKPQCTAITLPAEQVQQQTPGDKRLFIECFGVKIQPLNNFYFTTDTTSRYVIIPYDQLVGR